MFDTDNMSDNELAMIGGAAAAILTILCPPAIAVGCIVMAVNAGKRVKEERTEEKAELLRCETKSNSSHTIGFVYTGEVR